MGMCVCAYIYIAWQFKGVYEISVSVGNKVRMFGREGIACNFRLFIVRGVVGGGGGWVRLIVGRCGVGMATFFFDDRCIRLLNRSSQYAVYSRRCGESVGSQGFCY